MNHPVCYFHSSIHKVGFPFYQIISNIETTTQKPYTTPPLKRPNNWNTHADSSNPSKKPNTMQTEDWNNSTTVQASTLHSSSPQTVVYETPSIPAPQFLTNNSPRPQRDRQPPQKYTGGS
jgi:hypothetical protein